MSDRRKEAEEKMEKAIFISGDGWLAVFDLLPPSQLGLGIAFVSHRFDAMVDEHFKTRKWALKFLRIRRKIGENDTNEMEIANYNGKPMPIPNIQLPRKVIDFKCIKITFIDRNVIAFLHRFRPLFASTQIYLSIYLKSDRILELLRNILPMIGKNIYGMELMTEPFQRLRQIVPSLFFTECPSLRFVFPTFDDLFAEFPADDSAVASRGQALAKWLFTPHPDDVPKVFKCAVDQFVEGRNVPLSIEGSNLPLKIAAFKTAFANASAPANFIVVLCCIRSTFANSVVPFEQTNELTREQLALKRTKFRECFLLVRSPIARDANKWAKWEKEAIDWQIIDQWNKIDIEIDADGIGDGLLDATPGPSDQQK
ncbi:hypothetical protein niasHT_035837 [Heterodera trifolii]|uniref:F-box domain-containing protein n=1 Tax=Heterodera trifolii TaxID=157864 RepID=A0ABD2ILB7_9BILA